MRRIFTVISCIAFLAIKGSCFAQAKQSPDSNQDDFVPREKVVFEDDFSKDKVGSFPSGWKRLPGEKATPSNYCQVQADDDGNVLAMTDDGSDLEPMTGSDSYLTDSFTLEYDFMFESLEAN